MARVASQRLCQCGIRYRIKEFYVKIIIANAAAIESNKYRLSIEYPMSYMNEPCRNELRLCHLGNYLNLTVRTSNVTYQLTYHYLDNSRCIYFY